MEVLGTIQIIVFYIKTDFPISKKVMQFSKNRKPYLTFGPMGFFA
jgi:hypothetical protein